MKQPSKQLGKVLFLLDGSETNFEGLASAVEFCKLFGKQLTVLHTFNQDLRKHSKHVRMQLKGEERKDCKWETIFE